MTAPREESMADTRTGEQAAGRLPWQRPEVRTLAAGAAELTSTNSADGGASQS